jgi:hypothetical protein
MRLPLVMPMPMPIMCFGRMVSLFQHMQQNRINMGNEQQKSEMLPHVVLISRIFWIAARSEVVGFALIINVNVRVGKYKRPF